MLKFSTERRIPSSILPWSAELRLSPRLGRGFGCVIILPFLSRISPSSPNHPGSSPCLRLAQVRNPVRFRTGCPELPYLAPPGAPPSSSFTESAIWRLDESTKQLTRS